MKNNTLEPGDQIYSTSGWHKRKTIAGTIDRVTKTLAFIGGRKFKRKIDDDGRVDVVPRSYSHTSYYLLTENVIKEIGDQEYRLKKEKVIFDWEGNSLRSAIEKLPLSKLERIVEILEETEC